MGVDAIGGPSSKAEPVMRIALGQVPDATDDALAFARQLGLASIQVNTPRLPGERRWEYDDLIALRQRCEAAGLRLEAIENVPSEFYERAMLGQPGRDEEIENLQATTRNIGRAGIPESDYMHRGRAHAIGHMQGLLQAVLGE